MKFTWFIKRHPYPSPSNENLPTTVTSSSNGIKKIRSQLKNKIYIRLL